MIHNNRICNATNIKLLAVVLMFIDHIHQMFWNMGVPAWVETYLDGRSFRCFCF